MVKKVTSRLYMALIFLFLYLPIFVLIVLSFNNSTSRVNWGGFTLQWYINCFRNEKIMNAFATTLQITLLAAVISTLIGTLAAMGISAMKRRNQTIFLGATNIPLLNADIVTGISMMLLFVKFMNLGFVTVLIAHITFNIPYVILNVLPKLKQTNRYTYEAALDLGATPLYAFFKVTWPEIRSGVFSGFLMAVTMSLDDFSITYFTKGAGVNTLSTMLYTELRKGIRPELYALSTILFFTVLLLLVAANLHPEKTVAIPVNPEQTASPKAKKRIHRAYIAKRIASVTIIAVLILGSAGVFFTSAGMSRGERTLTVLNYGKYIDEEALRMFEEETGITVKYEEYEDPEEMYTKYRTGAISYDLICTSDYIVEKLIDEDEVLAIDFSKIDTYSEIDPTIIDMCVFDPDHTYSMPYFYGTLGLLYNTKLVDEEDVKSWDVLWNGKYAGEFTMMNSVRDSFSPALITLGYSINETEESRLREALDLLIAQSPDVAAYYVDETCDEMAAENFALALCYSGEAAAAMDINENLDYYVPEEGSNFWVDSWFIPKTCQNEDAAYEFLNFLNREDVAEMNFEYVYYASPVMSVMENMDAETRENETINPPKEVLNRCEVYRILDDDATALYNDLWAELKAN
ncbi:MAG: extracellular solute-binding protein [Lachnospiraceae bacterium]|nr:extracellular solute-binding protein [Lachnospiraceae bacterium]